MAKLCPHCQRPLPELRAGVRLSPLKAHIFDVIKRAGPDDVMFEDINAICFDGRSTAVNARTHVYQINAALAGTDLQIDGNNPRGFYRIVRWRVRAVA
jgi:hypothetical protein